MSAPRSRRPCRTPAAPMGLAVLLPLIAACAPAQGDAPQTGQALVDGADIRLAQAETPAASPDNPVSPIMTPAPEVFEAIGSAVWDGRHTLRGVWIAHPMAVSARRVRIFNTDNGVAVDGALFKRDATREGASILISSEAAELLGMTAGEPAKLRIVAVKLAKKPGVDREVSLTATETPVAAPVADAATAESDVAGDAGSPPPTAGTDEAAGAPAGEAETTGAETADTQTPASETEVTETGLPPTPQARPSDFAVVSARPGGAEETGNEAEAGPVETPGDTAGDPATTPSGANPAEAATGIAAAATETPEEAPAAGTPTPDLTFKLEPRPVPRPVGITETPVAEAPERPPAAGQPEEGVATADPAEDDATATTEPVAAPADPPTAAETTATPAESPAAAETASAPAERHAAIEPVAAPAESHAPDRSLAPTARPDRTPAGATPLNRPYIQAGLFGVEENAARLISRLEAKGVPALSRTVTSGERKFSRVLAGPFSMIADRDRAQEIIRGMGMSDAVPVKR